MKRWSPEIKRHKHEVRDLLSPFTAGIYYIYMKFYMDLDLLTMPNFCLLAVFFR